MESRNPIFLKTPLVEAPSLSRAAGCRVLLKLENLQPSGSFKSRGIGNYMLQYLNKHSYSNPNAHFYSSSGGNAGLACVVAGRTLGHPATVVVPMTTKPRMIDLLKTRGAHAVLQVGASWAEADAHLREIILAKDPSGVYVPPFDHEDIWDGNASLVDELVEEIGHMPGGALLHDEDFGNGHVVETDTGSVKSVPKDGARLAAVVCSVGGGGLLCGIMRGLASKPRWRGVSIAAVETRGADSLHQSVVAGKLVTLPGITSQATSLGAVRVAAQAFEYAKAEYGNKIRSVTVSDAEAARACCAVADEERMLVEMACGASVAVCLDPAKLEEVVGRAVRPDDVVVVVLCGGSNVTLSMMAGWQEEYLSSEKALPTL